MDTIRRVCDSRGYPCPAESTIRHLLSALQIKTPAQLQVEVERFVGCSVDDLVTKQEQDALWKWYLQETPRP